MLTYPLSILFSCPCITTYSHYLSQFFSLPLHLSSPILDGSLYPTSVVLLSTLMMYMFCFSLKLTSYEGKHTVWIFLSSAWLLSIFIQISQFHSFPLLFTSVSHGLIHASSDRHSGWLHVIVAGDSTVVNLDEHCQLLWSALFHLSFYMEKKILLWHIYFQSLCDFSCHCLIR